jgi:redox-sensitive bicupin YhaK (pirin superfamily)
VSNLRATPFAETCEAEQHAGKRFEVFPASVARLGQLDIRRALPRAKRRMVGPWCFLDRYGPLSFEAGKPMDVAPHPHIGLQTVSWLLDGEVFHRDSLGFENMIVPGELNLMTSGRGISHSEETPARPSGILNGVQLWVALPDAVRAIEPAFNHYNDLPVVETSGAVIRLIAGSLGGAHSPALTFSPIVGAQIDAHGETEFGLDSRFEHALLVLDGEASMEGESLTPDVLYYLGTSRSSLALRPRNRARVLLLGGAPFGERILMWWNFVARAHEEIERARNDWQQGTAFGEVKGYAGRRYEAPPLGGRAVAEPAS